MQENPSGLLRYVAGGAIKQFRRVALNTAGTLVAAAAYQAGLGTLQQEASADGDARTVKLNNVVGSRFAVSAAAAAVGADAYTAADGKVSPVAAAGCFYVGKYRTAASADLDLVEIAWEEPRPADVTTQTAGGALAQHLRVKFSTGKMAAAGITDKELGTTLDAATADGDKVRVEGRNAPLKQYVASVAMAIGAEVFSAASGKVGASASTAFRLGIAVTAAGADGDVFWVQSDPGDTAVS